MVARRPQELGLCTVNAATLPDGLLGGTQTLVCLTPIEALMLTKATGRPSLRTGVGLSLEEISHPRRIRRLQEALRYIVGGRVADSPEFVNGTP